MLWEGGQTEDEQESGDGETLLGLVNDPTLLGHKELFLLYSQEFGDFLRAHREQRRSKGDQIERMLRSFLPRRVKRAQIR